MINFLKTFVRDESGASAAEYALILAIVGVAIGAAALALGGNVRAAIAGAAKDVHECNTGEFASTSIATPNADCS